MPAIGSSSGGSYPAASGSKPPHEAYLPSIGSGNYLPGSYPLHGSVLLGSIGQSGVSIGGAPYHGPNPTPLLGRMASVPGGAYPSGPGTAVSDTPGHAGSYTSQQFSSPFVPASSSQPIIGGAASQYSLPGQATGAPLLGFKWGAQFASRREEGGR